MDRSEKLTIKVDNIHPAIMKQILQYLYTGTCDLINTGPCKIQIKRESSVPKEDNQIVNNDISAELIIDNANEVSGKKLKISIYWCYVAFATHFNNSPTSQCLTPFSYIP